MKRTVITMMLLMVLFSFGTTKVRAQGINEKEELIVEDEDINKINLSNIDLLKLKAFDLNEDAEMLSSISKVSKDTIVNSLFKKEYLFENDKFIFNTNYQIGKMNAWESNYKNKGYAIEETVMYVPIGYIESTDSIIFCKVTLKDFIIPETEFSKSFTTVTMNNVTIEQVLEVTEIN